MGEVIKPLADGVAPKHTIFDRRFVVECCETFHLHWRNLRLELTPENWRGLVATFERAIATWRAHGEPDTHPHLELGRFLMDVDDVVKPTELGVELCRNLYRDYRETHGADADFYEDDAFVHFHYRDMRFEMSVEDFLAFSRTMAEGRETLLPVVARPLASLFETLDEHNILYVVLRNWENLPEDVAVGPHSDLDLLVHPAHVGKLDALWGGERTFADPARVQRKVPVIGPDGERSYILVDVRSTDDGYMPEDFSHRLLARRERHKMFHVLPPREYFLSLLYHVVAHKGVMSDDYALRLLALAERAGIEYRAEDVHNFRVAARILDEHGIAISTPDDATVLPKLPFIAPLDTAIYSRWLVNHGGLRLESRVHALEGENGPFIRKQATADLASREHEFLTRLGGGRFPAPLAVHREPTYSVVDMEFVRGVTLDRALDGFETTAAQAFARECLEVLADLQAAGITHRDIKADNLVVRDDLPVLLDFGWAVADDLPSATPSCLGADTRAPEGFCDVYSMGAALAPLADRHPELLPLVAAMTAPAGERVTDVARLRALVEQAPAPAVVVRRAGEVARRLVAEGSTDAAVAALARHAALAPGEAEVAVAHATALLAAGREEEARAAFADALQLAPDSVRAAEGLAAALLALGDAGASVAALESVAAEAPPVTVVVVATGGADAVARTLAMLRENTPAGLHEVIAVDVDGEAAGVLTRARALHGVRLLRAARADALRCAAAAARGRHVVVVDTSSTPTLGWLEALVRLADADPEIGVLGSRVVHPDGTLRHAALALPLLGMAAYRGDEEGMGSALRPADVAAVAATGLLVRADLLRSVGGFDPTLPVAGQHIELCLRAWDTGARVVTCPTSLLVHQGDPAASDADEIADAWQEIRPAWRGHWTVLPWEERRIAEHARAAGIDGARAFAVIAFADELVDDPSLLTAFASAFGPADDATLVIYAPDGDASAVTEELGGAIAAAGIADDLSPDMMALVVPSDPANELGLSYAVRGALARRERDGAFAKVARFDESNIAALRDQAERTWELPAAA